MRSSGAIAAVVGVPVLSTANTAAAASVHRGGLASWLNASESVAAGALIVAVIGVVVVCALALAAIRAHRPTDKLRKFGERLKKVENSLKELKQQTNGIKNDTRYLSERTAPLVCAEIRTRARQELPTCEQERAATLLLNLYGCLEILDTSDIAYIDLASKHFPENNDIVTLAKRLIAEIRKRGDNAGAAGS